MLILRPSNIAGVGVFTLDPIKRGALIDDGPADDYVFIPRNRVKNKFLCDFYCVETAKGYYCARNFHQMSIGWYFNHSDNPNLCRQQDGSYRAARNIKRGSELTIDYRELDDEISNLILL